MKDKHTRKENLDVLELKNNATVDDSTIGALKTNLWQILDNRVHITT